MHAPSVTSSGGKVAILQIIPLGSDMAVVLNVCTY
jgi:hypothetical protein